MFGEKDSTSGSRRSVGFEFDYPSSDNRGRHDIETRTPKEAAPTASATRLDHGDAARKLPERRANAGAPAPFGSTDRTGQADTNKGPAPELSFARQLLYYVPAMRAFGYSLTRKWERTDDLVQETIVRALEHQSSFTPGTNLRAWLFTILRNSFLTEVRKRKHEVEDVDSREASQAAIPPAQQAHLDLEEFEAALQKLPTEQREALVLVGASGFSYEEAATICSVPVGTIKSRTSRAREQLRIWLEP